MQQRALSCDDTRREFPRAWNAIAGARLLLTDAGARWAPIARRRTPGARPERSRRWRRTRRLLLLLCGRPVGVGGGDTSRRKGPAAGRARGRWIAQRTAIGLPPEQGAL